MTENFPNLAKDRNLQIQETKQIPNRITQNSCHDTSQLNF